MPAPHEIIELVGRFEDNLGHTPRTYNQPSGWELIDPFSEALGWIWSPAGV